MKRKEIKDSTTTNGFYVTEFVKGFFGERNEGRSMLRLMGLPTDKLPFSAVSFIQNRRACWKDHDGRMARIAYKYKNGQLECRGSYLGNSKSIRMFLEWEDFEDPALVSVLESGAIGDLCMKCIYEKLIE